MYSVLTFQCPDVCTAYCCCKPPVVEPPPTPVSCGLGTAYGCGPGYANFNGVPIGPALTPKTCNK